MRPRAVVRPAGWTLHAKLIVSTVALYLLVMLATGAMTVLASKQYLLRQLDGDLMASSARAEGGPRGRGDGGFGGPPGGGASQLQVGFRGEQVLTDKAGNPLNYVVTTANTATTLDSDQLSLIRSAGLGNAPRTVEFGGDIGTYRLVARHTQNGLTLVTGLPTAPVDTITSQILVLVTGGTFIGLAMMTAGGTLLIRRNLEPLARVAATARRVSNLRLDSGRVAMPERVSAADTDARTEVGQVGLALNNLLDNVDGALRARHESELRVRRFVADASHELRTPLASIRGYAELSRRGTEPVPPAVSHALGRVEAEALRMTSLVEDLLLLARLDEGRPLERAEVDLTLLTLNAVSDAHAASPGHLWQLDLPEEPVTVTGDSARLHQVLTNLLANARTHTPEGTTVVTSVRPDGDLVTISVTDNGPGIPEALQRNVFERFTRGDDSRSRAAGSTGLGLSIVAAVGHAHGGRVAVESRPGRTRFSLSLPI